MAKATKIEYQQRIEQIFDLICEGKKFHHITKYATKNGWDIGKRQLQNLYYAASKLVLENIPDHAQAIAELRLKLADRLVKANDIGDIRASIQVLRMEAELLGAFPSKTAAAKPASTKGLVEDMMSDPETVQLLKDAQTWTPATLKIAAPGEA